jgi:hypothetical protein
MEAMGRKYIGNWAEARRCREDFKGVLNEKVNKFFEVKTCKYQKLRSTFPKSYG